jgi:DNA-binding IclR family transcriptional regulator
MPETVARQLVARSIGAPLTPYTVTDVEAAMARIATARQLGFAIASQECFVGDISVAAAIVPQGREVVGAVNIAVSSSVWTEADVLARLAPTVIETAAAIARVQGES